MEEGEEMSEPVNIFPRIPGWSNQQPEYRTEGCLPTSLVASPRLKKPRKETTATKKKGKKEATTGERRKELSQRPSRFYPRRSAKRSSRIGTPIIGHVRSRRRIAREERRKIFARGRAARRKLAGSICLNGASPSTH